MGKEESFDIGAYLGRKPATIVPRTARKTVKPKKGFSVENWTVAGEDTPLTKAKKNKYRLDSACKRRKGDKAEKQAAYKAGEREKGILRRKISTGRIDASVVDGVYASFCGKVDALKKQNAKKGV